VVESRNYELQETMDVLTDVMGKIARHRSTALSNHRKMLVDEDLGYALERIEGADLVTKPENPPSAPANVTVTAYARALFVRWDAPIEAEYVTSALLLVRRSGTTAVLDRIVVAAENLGHVVVPKELKQTSVQTNAGGAVTKATPTVKVDGATPPAYEVEVSFIDRWDRSSASVTTPSMTPKVQAVDYIVADNILAGNIYVGMNVLAGGSIAAGGARLDEAGMELTDSAEAFSSPSDDSASKITNTAIGSAGIYGAFGFFNAPNIIGGPPPRRGIYQRVDGDTTGGSRRRGQIRLDVSGVTGQLGVVGADGVRRRFAQIIMQAEESDTFDETFITMRPRVVIDGGLKVSGGVVELDNFNVLRKHFLNANNVPHPNIVPMGSLGDGDLPAQANVRAVNLNRNIVNSAHISVLNLTELTEKLKLRGLLGWNLVNHPPIVTPSALNKRLRNEKEDWMREIKDWVKRNSAAPARSVKTANPHVHKR
jgi:hypothetical protein